MIYLELFLTFLMIGAITFGGGYAMLPLLKAEVVEKRRFLTEEEFSNLYNKNEFIETPQMLERHLVGYDIIKRLFTDEQILKYTRLNLTVYSQYHSTCLAQWVGDKDYKLGCSGHVWVKDYDEYGRELKTEHQIPRFIQLFMA